MNVLPSRYNFPVFPGRKSFPVSDLGPSSLKSLVLAWQGEAPAYSRPFMSVSLSFATLLAAFVFIDLGLILANALAIGLHHFGLIDAVPEMLRITQDHAIPEDFNYLKWAIIVSALVWMSIRDRWLPPALWAVVFAMILADDSMQLHEKLGAAIATWTGLPSSTYFYADDLGEMLAFGLMGLVTLALTATLFTRRGVSARALSLRYGLVILALGGFGVGIDAVHQLVSHFTEGTSVATLLSQLFGMIEEGGEMIVASVAVAMTLASDDIGAVRRKDAPPEA
jgi:hypothetical protein